MQRADGKGITLSADITSKDGNIIIPRGAQIVTTGNRTQIVWGNGQHEDVGVQASVSPQDVYFVQTQRNWLTGYRPADFRHDEGIQTVSADRDTFKRWGFDLDHGFGIVNARASEEGFPKEINTKPVLSDESINWYRLAFWMSRNVESQAEIAYLQSQLTMLARVLYANRELAVWGPGFTNWDIGVMVDPANWHANVKTTLGAGFQWGGPSGEGANSDPVKNLQDSSSVSLNPIVEHWMNRNTANAMTSNSTYLAKVRTVLGQDRWSPDAQLARSDMKGGQRFTIPNLPGEVCVIDSKITNPDTGNEVYTFPDGVVIGLHKSSTTQAPVSGQEVASGYLWKRRAPGGSPGEINVRTQVIEGRGFGGTLWLLEMGFKPSQVAPKVGYYLEDALQ